MKKTWIIAHKELAGFFDSLIAYILLVVFLGIGGIMTWWYGFIQPPVLESGMASLTPFFINAYMLIIIFVPALTMRTLAEERKVGTLDLLMTKAVTDWQIVFGKFLACLILIAVALLCTLPYYLILTSIGSVDHGAVFSGYLAVLLMSAAYIALGVFASSVTNSQIVAFLLALFMGIILHVVFALATGYFTGPLGATIDFLSTWTHYQSMSRGVIDSRDLIYFLSFIVIGLSLAEVNLAKRLIRGS